MSEGYKMTPFGEIPQDWELVKLDELVDETRGVTYGIVQPGPYDPNGRYLVRGKDYSTGWADPEDFFRVSDKVETPYKRARLKENDLITTIVGAGVGNMQIVPKWLDGANITQTTARIAIDESKGYYRFYYHVLCSNIGKYNVRLFEKGGAQPGLNLADIKKYSVPLPSLTEQQKIAEILSTVDEKIDVIDAQISQTTELKKGLMQRLLTKGIGHTQFKDSPLGEIPESWEVCALDELKEKGASISYGVVQPGPDIPEGVLFIRGGDIKNGKISENLRRISEQVSDQYKRTLLKGGELLISLVGYPGECAIVPKSLTGANIARQVGIIRVDGRHNSIYIQQYLSSPIGKKNLLGNLVGSAQQVINLDMLRKVEIPLPSDSEQQKIAEILSTVDEKIDVLKDKKSNYQELKKGLMQQLLTGKIRVNQAN